MNLRSWFKLARRGKSHGDPLSKQIQAKWIRDQAHLPLTNGHWELYEIIHRLYWNELQDFPELVQCRDLNDRIQWLKLFDQDEEIIRCMDKIRVRDFVRERTGENHLTELYQTCDHFKQINFDALPNQFVIKTNHDSGSVILVRDKNNFDRVAAASRVENSLQKKYGWQNGEWAYAFIPPKILVEEFIAPDELSPPPDYKFYVVAGQVRFLHFIYGRGVKAQEQIIDIDGHDLAINLYPSFGYGNAFQKPALWNELKRLAEKLGRGFKFVRVDLYCSRNKIYAGELTFWPMAGCYQGDGQKKLGHWLDFDRTTFKPPIYQVLKKNGR